MSKTQDPPHKVPKAKAWLLALRPATLPLAVAPVLVGSSLASRSSDVDWWLAGAAALGAIALQITSNLVNDAADHARGTDDEERLGPARAAAMGWLTGRELWVGALLSLLLALLCGGWLIAAGGWPVLLVGLSGALAAIAYTAGPYPLGYVGLGDVFVLLFFGFAAVVTTFYILTGTTTAASWCLGGAMGALATGVLVVNNLRDRVGDAKHGKRTLAVRFGATGARVEYTLLLCAPFVVVLLGFALGWWGPWAFVSALALPWALWLVRGVWLRDGAALNPFLGATARLTVLFGVLFSAGVVW